MIIKLDYKVPNNRDPEDLKMIIRAALEYDYLIDAEEAYKIWDEYSDSMAAGWMGLDEGAVDYIVWSYLDEKNL